MRFDGKSPEEIHESVLKEGVWSKWLKVEGPDAERIAEARQEIMDMEEEDDLLDSSIEDMLLPLLSGIRPPKHVKEIEAYSIKSKRNQVGEDILYRLAQAEKSVYVTQFCREKYSELYHAILLEKINHGVVVRRVVADPLEYADDYKWLDDYRDDNGNPIQNYTEHTLKSNRQFNFDFMIIDEECVILAHRGRHHNDDVLIIESASLAKIFLNIWHDLLPQKDNEGKMTDFKISVTCHQRRKRA
jgi:hypothetical protein